MQRCLSNLYHNSLSKPQIFEDSLFLLLFSHPAFFLKDFETPWPARIPKFCLPLARACGLESNNLREARRVGTVDALSPSASSLARSPAGWRMQLASQALRRGGFQFRYLARPFHQRDNGNCASGRAREREWAWLRTVSQHPVFAIIRRTLPSQIEPLSSTRQRHVLANYSSVDFSRSTSVVRAPCCERNID